VPNPNPVCKNTDRTHLFSSGKSFAVRSTRRTTTANTYLQHRAYAVAVLRNVVVLTLS
jgi:hypothetical protein